MKQFTTKEQTDRLIELGYPKPNSIKSAKMGFFMGTKIPCIEKEFAYSIGELMELLPPDKYFGKELIISYSILNSGWICNYGDLRNNTYNKEAVDALYEMLVKIKAEE